MENGDIKNDQITASSFYQWEGGREPWKGRLNSDSYWRTSVYNPTDPWIQVDLLQSTVVTGITTQGSGTNQLYGWIIDVQIQYGDSVDTLMYIIETGQPKVNI